MARDQGEQGWGRPDVLDRAGSRIHYWVAGPDDAPLVAFTHGATMDHRMFDPQRDPVTAAGYRVLAWDVRGHGVSKPIGADFDLSLVTDDLLAIVDRLGYEEAAFVGHSFGGLVSQEVAFRHPERVAALTMIGATNVTDPPRTLEYLALRASPYLFEIWPDGHLRTVVAENTAKTDAVRRYAFEATNQLSKREFLTVWRGVATSFHSEPGYRVRQPLLLTHGDDDRVGTIARDVPAWAEREPDARYEVIPDAGHNANQDNPASFNEVLLSFLTEHVPV